MLEDWVIELREVGEEGLRVERSLPVDWLQHALGKSTPYQVAGDGHLSLELNLAEDVVRVRGVTSLPLLANCSRCLDEVAMSLDAKVDVAVFPRGAEPAATVDGELSDDDLGVASYGNDRIAIGRLVLDEMLLELPMRPLCNETCSGLCPDCGENRNHRRCDCTAPRSTWAAALVGVQKSMEH
jgi:uncharacterized protein